MSVRVNILGTKISECNISSTINVIRDALSGGKPAYVCVSNVHTVVTGRKDHRLQEATNNSLLSVPDGMPLVWAMKLRGTGVQTARVSGVDLMESVFDISREYGLSHFFFGGTPDVLGSLVYNVKQRWPGINISGYHSPAFTSISRTETISSIQSLINVRKPDIIWICLGAPKQEKWMLDYYQSFSSGVLIGVGAAFNVLSGHLSRAPFWMRSAGLEWLYRLLQEPKRLWKRYLNTNFYFLFYLIHLLINRFFGNALERGE